MTALAGSRSMHTWRSLLQVCEIAMRESRSNSVATAAILSGGSDRNPAGMEGEELGRRLSGRWNGARRTRVEQSNDPFSAIGMTAKFTAKCALYVKVKLHSFVTERYRLISARDTAPNKSSCAILRYSGRNADRADFSDPRRTYATILHAF